MKVYQCPHDRRFSLEVSDEPTVHGPNESNGTLYAAVNFGELCCGETVESVPENVRNWLDRMQDEL